MNLVQKPILRLWFIHPDGGHHALINKSLDFLSSISVLVVWDSQRYDLNTILVRSVKLIVIVDKVFERVILEEIFHESDVVDFVEVDDLKEFALRPWIS